MFRGTLAAARMARGDRSIDDILDSNRGATKARRIRAGERIIFHGPCFPVAKRNGIIVALLVSTRVVRATTMSWTWWGLAVVARGRRLPRRSKTRGEEPGGRATPSIAASYQTAPESSDFRRGVRNRSDYIGDWIVGQRSRLACILFLCNANNKDAFVEVMLFRTV